MKNSRAKLDKSIAKDKAWREARAAMQASKPKAMDAPDAFDKRPALSFTSSPAKRRRVRYAEHINSPEWKIFRATIIAKRGAKCERCGSAKAPLNLHHKHYRNFRHERDTDVVVLCVPCHEAAHGRKVG